jgi:hypothetical protein
LDNKTSEGDPSQTIEYIDMRGDIFAADIISNCLNLKTFFKPIVYLSGIGVLTAPPPSELYMRLSSHTAQAIADRHICLA